MRVLIREGSWVQTEHKLLAPVFDRAVIQWQPVQCMLTTSGRVAMQPMPAWYFNKDRNYPWAWYNNCV